MRLNARPLSIALPSWTNKRGKGERTVNGNLPLASPETCQQFQWRYETCQPGATVTNQSAARTMTRSTTGCMAEGIVVRMSAWHKLALFMHMHVPYSRCICIWMTQAPLAMHVPSRCTSPRLFCLRFVFFSFWSREVKPFASQKEFLHSWNCIMRKMASKNVAENTCVIAFPPDA